MEKLFFTPTLTPFEFVKLRIKKKQKVRSILVEPSYVNIIPIIKQHHYEK